MKRKILLVDDEEIFLRPLSRTIVAAGFLVAPLEINKPGFSDIFD